MLKALSRRLAGPTLGLALLAGPALANDPRPPGDIPAGWQVAQLGPEAAAQSVRVGQLEEQMRALNGRIEELTWQIQQLQAIIQRQQEDVDFRLRAVEGNPPGKRSDAAPSGAPATDLSAGFSIDSPMDGSGAPAPGQELGAPPQVLGTLPGDASHGGAPSESALGGPLDLSAIARGEPGYQPPATIADVGAPVAAGPLPTPVADAPLAAPAAGTQVAAAAEPADPRAAYDAAYAHVVAGDYEAAASGFERFLAKNPKNRLAGNAHYWLGESRFALGRYRDAADSFLTTYRDHPTSAKAPESLLKLALSLEGLGEKTAACATYRELEKKFPDAGTILARAAEQKTKAGC